MNRIKKFVGVPARGQRSGFSFAVADHAHGNQVGIVKHRAVSVSQRITQLAAFIDRARSFRGHVAGNAAGKGELFEQLLHTLFILGDVRIKLAVGAFQIGIGYQAGAAMSGAGDVNHIQIIFIDEPVEMNIDKIKTRGSSPVAEQTRFHMIQRQRLFQKWIVIQVNLSDGKIIGGAPVSIHLAQHVAG